MGARRYEISLRVEKYFTSERSEWVKYFFNTRRGISYLQAAMQYSIYYINTNELPNHFTLIVYYVAIATVIFSHVKITCYFFLSLRAGGILQTCNLIGSESGRFFTILPANPGGIVGSFIHKFVCRLWMSKTGDF